MAFSSRLEVGEPIINDSTKVEDVTPADAGRGLQLAFRKTPFGAMANAPPFPKELLIPKNDWQAIIQEREEKKQRMQDLIDRAGLPHKDQAQTNYCWINAPVHTLEMIRVLQNQQMVILSPASAGAPIKNFRNVGGWGEEGLSWLVDKGCVPVSLWPANAIDRRYYTEENKSLALTYRVTHWYELRPRNVEDMVSAMLRYLPLAGGYNWWGHEITNYDPVWLDGTVAVRIRNSWNNWGVNGYGILQGSKMLADDLVCPAAAIAA